MIRVEKYQECLSFKNKFHRLLWGIGCALLFRPFKGPFFWRWRNTVLRLAGANIGRGCKISASARIWAPWNLTTGQFTAIGSNAIIYYPAHITLGSKVVISQYAYLCSASHNITSCTNKLVTAPIEISSFAWIATDAFIGMGIKIGEGAVIGARAAVFKDVDPWTVCGGNPAKFLKKRVVSQS